MSRETEEEALKVLEIENGLTLVPRVKLNLTVYPSTPLTLSHPIDEWKMKRALINFLQTSHSLSLPEDDLQIKRLKDLKKRKRDDPVAAATLHIWDLSSLQTEDKLRAWRTRLADSVNGIELNLQGVKFKLAAAVPVSDDFQGMKKDWEEFYAFQNRGFNTARREPDTIVLRGVPSRWFAEPRVSSKPSMLVTHTIFSTFGKIRNLNVAEDDDLGKDANEDSGDLVSGLYCKIVVQFEQNHWLLRFLSSCRRSDALARVDPTTRVYLPCSLHRRKAGFCLALPRDMPRPEMPTAAPADIHLPRARLRRQSGQTHIETICGESQLAFHCIHDLLIEYLFV